MDLQLETERVTAKDVMTSALHYVKAGWSLRDLGRFFVKHKISGAPVKDHQSRWVGVVSVTDLAKHAQYSNPKDTLEEVHRFYDEFLGQEYCDEDVEILTELAFSSHTVKDIMTPNVLSVPASATLLEVTNTILRRRVHRVLVEDKGNLIGIISSLDLLRYFSEAAYTTESA